jgi:lysophospholipase L1-like esterase
VNKISSMAFVGLLLNTLIGCNGGGGGSDDPIPEPPPPPGIPVASSASFATLEDKLLSEQLIASDPDGRALTFSISSQPEQGTVELLDQSSGTFTYLPNPGIYGSDQFTFMAGNGVEVTNTATVTIAIEAVNLPPITEDTCWTTPQALAVNGTVTATDDASPAELLSYSVVQDGTKGSVELAADGSFAYTPNTTGARGDDSFTYEVLDTEGASATGVTTIVIDQKLMPLGDSITEGVGDSPDPPSSERIGYRRDLYQALVDIGGYGVDFVGSLSNGEGATPGIADANHEGHSGWNATEIFSGRLGGYPNDGVRAWLDANPADIILLHIGTNDLEDTSATDIGNILDAIDLWESGNNPVTVVVARILDGSPVDSAVTAFNNSVASMAHARIAAGDHIVVVDQQSALNYPADLADDTHPTPSGYQKMAAVWLHALLEPGTAQGQWSQTGPLEKCP